MSSTDSHQELDIYIYMSLTIYRGTIFEVYVRTHDITPICHGVWVTALAPGQPQEQHAGFETLLVYVGI